VGRRLYLGAQALP